MKTCVVCNQPVTFDEEEFCSVECRAKLPLIVKDTRNQLEIGVLKAKLAQSSELAGTLRDAHIAMSAEADALRAELALADRALIDIGSICDNTHGEDPISDAAAVSAIEDVLTRKSK